MSEIPETEKERLDWYIMYELKEENKKLRDKINELTLSNNQLRQAVSVLLDEPTNSL